MQLQTIYRRFLFNAIVIADCSEYIPQFCGMLYLLFTDVIEYKSATQEVVPQELLPG